MPGSWQALRPRGKLTMLLTITLTEPPATDLGFLLHKHPDRLQSFAVSAGEAHVFYPEAAEQRCTAALLLEIDPIGLVRARRRAASGRGGPDAFSLAEYVNDRPYAASSMLAVALGKVFRTAMTGRCDARPELAARALPLEISDPGAVLPRRRRPGAPAAPPAGLGRAGPVSPARPGTAGVGRLPLPHRPADGAGPAGRRAQPPVRAAAGAGRQQALLGQRRRDRQAAPRRRGLAGRRTPSGT